MTDSNIIWLGITLFGIAAGSARQQRAHLGFRDRDEQAVRRHAERSRAAYSHNRTAAPAVTTRSVQPFRAASERARPKPTDDKIAGVTSG
jgi:hypothetical protein